MRSTPLCVLCAPDKFRGTLTAPQAAAALAAGARDAGARETVELPLADGGEGTLEALLAARGGERHTADVTGPLGEPVQAAWGLLPDGVAVVELAQAAGLSLVEGRNDPVAASTRGVGELVAAAAAAGARAVLVGVGGSATTDGGLGAVEALGWSLPLPLTVACDVATPFLDAARVFAPQKEAEPAEVDLLTRRLEALALRYRAATGVDVTALRGGGAAGGTAGGLAAIGARLRPGFALVAEAAGFPAHLERAGLVLSGEGRLDATSLEGKVVGEVLRAAAARGVQAAVVAGEVSPDVTGRLPGAARAVSLVELAGSAAAASDRAAALVSRAAALLVGDQRRPGQPGSPGVV